VEEVVRPLQHRREAVRSVPAQLEPDDVDRRSDPRDLVRISVSQIVQDQHAAHAFLEEGPDQTGADEAAAAGDDGGAPLEG
jgi:hypothetical protein